MSYLPGAIDFDSFQARALARRSDPVKAARAAGHLIEGALRIRRGGDGLYGDVPQRPITKPAEAVGAWLKSLERDMLGGDFQRSAELREAVIAAAEEVDAAAREIPAASRLRSALYDDALVALGGEAAPTNRSAALLPWILASLLGGVLLGVLISRK